MKRLSILAIAPLCVALWAATALADDPPQEEDLFTRLDANKDGFVSPDEVDEEKQSLYDRLLRTADKNEDGKLSREEFTQGTTPKAVPGRADGPRPGFGRPGGFLPRPEDILRRLDRNSDGKLTKEEMPEQMQQGFDRMDANGDGSVDAAEFGRAVAAFAPRRPDSPRPDAPRPDNSRPDSPRPDSPRPENPSTDNPRPEGPRPGEPGRPGFFPGGPPPLGAGLMRALDTDQDGQISADEIAGAVDALKKLDKDEDGTISREELLAGMPGGFPGMSPEQRDMLQSRVREMLDRVLQADADGDGKISREEAPERMRERFDQVDRNGDGVIDREEMEGGIRAMFSGGRPDGAARPEGTDGEGLRGRFEQFRNRFGRPGQRGDGDTGRPENGRPQRPASEDESK